MPKRSIRSRFLAERQSRSADFVCDSSLEIQKRLLLSDAFAGVSTVALYSAIHNEVQTMLVAEQALVDGKRLVYPRVRGEELEFVEVENLDDLTPGSFGVLEPRGQKVVPVDELDLVVVPGVVFDLGGHRLGYGRGYYDRTLASCRDGCVKVGFAYDFQLIEALPAAGHDQTLSVLITENRIHDFTPGQ